MRSPHVVCRYFLDSTRGDPEHSRSILAAPMLSLPSVGDGSSHDHNMDGRPRLREGRNFPTISVDKVPQRAE